MASNTAGITAGITVAGIASAVLVVAWVVPGKTAHGRGGAAVPAPDTARHDAPVLDAARPGSAATGPDDRGPDAASCRCGHDAAAHEHFRIGSDCGVCGAERCGRFRAARSRTVRQPLRRGGLRRLTIGTARRPLRP